MRKVRWLSWLGAVAVTVALFAAPAWGVTSDRAAAILKYPVIAAGTISISGNEEVDTLVQLSNTSDLPVNVHCFYENTNAHCADTGEVCNPYSPDCSSGPCVPGWNELDFWIRLTPRQPIAWLASEGEDEFKLDGHVLTGVGGSSNFGSRIPPVPESPFIGALKCVVVDDYGTPIDQNVIKGEATFVDTGVGDGNLDIAKYNAIGIRAIDGAVNGDRELVLGGLEAEYEGCPSVLIANHFFDGAWSPASDVYEATMTVLTLVPCEQDLLRQICGRTVVQYLVYNEFEQRFSTSRTVNCQQVLPISLIDTVQPERSIFSAGVAGTMTGQTRLSPLEAGLVGAAFEVHGSQTGAFNIHFQGERAEADLITLP